MSKVALWQRRSARQVVAQYTARRSPSAWCEDEDQRISLVRSLCLSLIFAIALRIPDEEIGAQLLEIWRRAHGFEAATEEALNVGA